MACGQPNGLLGRFSSPLCRNLISSLRCKCMPVTTRTHRKGGGTPETSVYVIDASAGDFDDVR